MEIGINSRYENFYNFIRYLENSPKVTMIDDINLKPKEPLNDSLIIKANIEVYLNL